MFLCNYGYYNNLKFILTFRDVYLFVCQLICCMCFVYTGKCFNWTCTCL